MKTHPIKSSLLSLLSMYCLQAQANPDHLLHFEAPARNWQTEALPIGNGNLGAMVFGQVERERFMLNEDSVWIGDEKDTGSYQALGDLYVTLHPILVKPTYLSPKNQGQGGNNIELIADGDLGSKWCFEHKDEEIVAIIEYSGKVVPPLVDYTISSANDEPARDPSSWIVEGSPDGESWVLIDRRDNEPRWEQRFSPRKYTLKKPASFRYYRFTFQPSKEAPHFQIAELSTNIAEEKTTATNYKRSLDLQTALHETRYDFEGVSYRRQAFSSYPAGVMVYHFEANQPGAHSGSIEFVDAHGAATLAQGNTLTSSGDLKGFKYGYVERRDGYGIYLDYETQVKVLHQGGRIRAADGRIDFQGCDSLTILVAADTNYLNQRDSGWKGPHPHEKLSNQLRQAASLGFDRLKSAHIADYQKLYQRFEVSLPQNKNSALPTDQRLEIYQEDPSDHSLEVLLLHYARYLMISCSRPGSLPANLQGMWNNSNNPPWRSDYHSDVNLQMNYWFVDQTNLSECFEPLAEYQASVREVRRENTRAHYGEHIRGWATRSENGIFGGSSYIWVPGDAAWLAQNLWDHYAYTRDKTYLKEVAYPIIKEICQFWEDYAIETPDGKLISPPSVSPEHGPFVAGNSYEDQLMYDLFTNFIEASKDLGVDAEYRKTVSEMRANLLGPQIGRWGQLQEWMEDIDDPKNQHRHLSHLIAVYPGRQISPLTTPKLAEAAAVSLDARGDSGTGWSIGWKINLWARLYNGDRAYRILKNSLKVSRTTQIVMNYAGGTYHNLLMAHPPFQIEANFGYASGFCELLMQSHLGEIHLLPSLPTAWPDGRIRGLKARGGHEVDILWKDGELEKARITSPGGNFPPIRVGNQLIDPRQDTRIILRGK